MNDKELLELAAKGAGYALSEEWDCFRDGIEVSEQGRERFVWNPLVDDGDALQLAVKLKIAIHPGYGSTTASTLLVSETYLDSNNPCNAARRAIVRAAAEIGKTK